MGVFKGKPLKMNITKPENLIERSKTTSVKSTQIDSKTILRLEGFVNYTYIYTNIGKFIFAKTLKSIAKKLDARQFIRTHKSHIVNKKYIKQASFAKSAGIAKLINGIEIDVSRSRMKDVKKLISTSN